MSFTAINCWYSIPDVCMNCMLDSMVKIDSWFDNACKRSCECKGIPDKFYVVKE